MTFTPIAPTTYVPPTQVAEDTFVIHQVQPALGRAAVRLPQLDGDPRQGADDRRHGTPANREQWLEGRVLARRAGGRAVDLPVARRRRPHRQPRRGDDGVPERAARVQLGDDRAAHELLRLPARPLPLDHGRRVARHRRPHAAGAAAAGVRLADDPRAVRSDDRRVLGGRHVRDAAARSEDGRSPISTPSSGTSAWRCSRSAR